MWAIRSDRRERGSGVARGSEVGSGSGAQRALRAAALFGVLAAACGWAPAAYAKTPVPLADLHLGAPDATRTYGQPAITGKCSATSHSYQTTVSLSAGANGDGVLTIGSPDSAPTLNSVYELSASQLELDRSTSGTAGSQTYTVTSTLDGYGTRFTGMFDEVYTDTQGSVVCTVKIPESLTLQGTGLTLAGAPGGGGTDHQQVDGAASGLEQSVDELLSGSVDSSTQDITTSIDPGAPGTVDATLVFDGSGGAGSSVLVFEGSGGSGSSVLVFDGSGGSGSSVLVFDGSGSSGSSIFAPCSAAGDGYDCDGSTGQGSAVLTLDGSSGSGWAILAPPTEGPGSINDTLTFDGSGSSTSALFNLGSSAHTAASAGSQHAKKVKLCIRRYKHATPECKTLRAVADPFIATTHATLTAAGRHTLTLPVSKTGKALLIAEREADRLYRKHHPHGHDPPKLPLKVVVSYLPAG